MLKLLNQNKGLIGYAIAGVAGAAWGIAHAIGSGALVDPYVSQALAVAGALIAAGKLPSDQEARIR